MKSSQAYERTLKTCAYFLPIFQTPSPCSQLPREIPHLKANWEEVPCGAGAWGSSVVTAVAWVTAAVWVQSLARELPHAMGAEEKKKKKAN